MADFKRFETTDSIAKNARKRANEACGTAIVALLLGILAGGLALGYGITNSNDIYNNAIIANTQNQLLRAEIYDALMNVSSTGYNMTLIKNGTFDWYESLSPTTVTSNYSLNHVQIGPLSFNVLKLYPPATPLPIPSAGYEFRMINFTPRIDQIILVNQPLMAAVQVNIQLLRLSDSNARKFNISSGCLINTDYGQANLMTAPAPACYITGIAGSDTGPLFGINALGVNTGNPSLSPNNYYFFGVVQYLSGFQSGLTFTINSPLELILPVS